MLKRKSALFYVTIICILTILLYTGSVFSQAPSSLVRSGLRSSVYGFNSFPDSSWWYNAVTDMATRFPGASPTVIWILGYTMYDGCYLPFPKPNDGITYDDVYFNTYDAADKFLSDFDENGIKVWLQFEPGNADVLELIDLVLTKYSHHSCVIGVGIDVEWYKTEQYQYGKAVTDEEAKAWSNRIKSYNENYLLFTKHWMINRMPPTFRDDIVFVDDSQIFQSMNSMINEFETWSKAFSPAKVAFQYGYESDKHWWKNLSDPPKNIGDEILKKCPNISGLYWVDFTAYDIWPEDFSFTSIGAPDDSKNLGKIKLHQNFPNPFNPVTEIYFFLPRDAIVEIHVFDILGNKIIQLLNDQLEAGNHNLTFDGSNLTSGIYFYTLKTPIGICTKKCLLIK